MTRDAATILRSATTVLLDFDGPVTPLMPPPVNMETANACREALLRNGVALPEKIATTSDHPTVLHWAWKHAPTAMADVERACAAVETRAARTCVPTPGAHQLLAALHTAGVPVIVVSNNAAGAIREYLARHGLTGYVHDVVGRAPGRPDLMKPHPYPVHEALRAAGTQPDHAVLIGDTLSDVGAAKAAGVRVIGYARTPAHVDELRDAGADAITTDMDLFVPA